METFNKQECFALRQETDKEERVIPKSLRAFIVILTMGMGPVTVGATDFVSSNAADVAAFKQTPQSSPSKASLG